MAHVPVAVLPARQCDVSVRLHPLLVMNVSDHMTRMRYLAEHGVTVATASDHDEAKDSDAATRAPMCALAPVLGVLIGRRDVYTGAIEIVTSTEVVYEGTTSDDACLPRPPRADMDDDDDDARHMVARQRSWYVAHIDHDALQSHVTRLMEVYHEHEVVGWYTVGTCMDDLLCCAPLHARLSAMQQQQQQQQQQRRQRQQDGDTSAHSALLALFVDTAMPHVDASMLPISVFRVTRSTSAAAAASQLHEQPHADGARAAADAPASAASDAGCWCARDVTFDKVTYALYAEEMEHIGMDAAASTELYAQAAQAHDSGTPCQGDDTRVRALLPRERTNAAQAYIALARAHRSLQAMRQSIATLAAHVDALVQRHSTPSHTLEATALTPTDCVVLRNAALACNMSTIVHDGKATCATALTQASECEQQYSLLMALLSARAHAVAQCT